MNVDIGNYPKNVEKAVRFFWKSKRAAKRKKRKSGKTDQGQRGGATAGKNLDGFVELIVSIIKSSANKNIRICTSVSEITLPGFFRVTKRWDIVVLDDGGAILAAIELKSLGGPSYGNNANNRCEEAIGTAVDFKTAQKVGAFGKRVNPFLGYLILVEDDDASRRPPIKPSISPHFKNDSVFKDASYQQRMGILCERLVQKRIYDGAAAIAAPDNGGKSGGFTELSETCSLKKFLFKIAAHIATETI